MQILWERRKANRKNTRKQKGTNANTEEGRQANRKRGKQIATESKGEASNSTKDVQIGRKACKSDERRAKNRKGGR